MRKAIKSILLVVTLLVVLLMVLVFDLSPIIKPNGSAQVDNADTVQPLLEQVRKTVRRRYQAQTIQITADQANSIAGFLQRAREQAKAEMIFEKEKMVIKVSYRLSAILGDVYFNLHTEVNQGNGINISKFCIGKLCLPGNLALDFAEYAANKYTESAVATKTIATVKTIDVKPDHLTIALAPLDTLLREFKNIKTGGSTKDTRLLKIRIAHYLRMLSQLYVPPPKLNAPGSSLGYYIQALMQEAHVMSKQGSATLENEAAILALTIYAGSPRFATLTGDLSFAIERIPSAKPKPVLLNRQDLSLHFIFSAAIKLMSEKGVSVAVGEFKELMDRGQGGSGYSFIDLAADLSGAHFASLAVDPKTAEHIQEVLMHTPDESLFMVAVKELEEGMSKAQFEAKYSNVDSPKYLSVVGIIEQRIEQLAITKEQ